MTVLNTTSPVAMPPGGVAPMAPLRTPRRRPAPAGLPAASTLGLAVDHHGLTAVDGMTHPTSEAAAGPGVVAAARRGAGRVDHPGLPRVEDAQVGGPARRHRAALVAEPGDGRRLPRQGGHHFGGLQVAP